MVSSWAFIAYWNFQINHILLNLYTTIDIVEYLTTMHNLDREERAGCFAWFVFLVSRDWCVALPRGAMGLSAVCDCGIS